MSGTSNQRDVQERTVDVAVIGAGTAGLAAFRAAAAMTPRVLLIEAGPYGSHHRYQRQRAWQYASMCLKNAKRAWRIAALESVGESTEPRPPLLAKAIRNLRRLDATDRAQDLLGP